MLLFSFFLHLSGQRLAIGSAKTVKIKETNDRIYCGYGLFYGENVRCYGWIWFDNASVLDIFSIA